jgi:hypothetical protein
MFRLRTERFVALFATVKGEMNVDQMELCGKCSAEIDPTRRVDFTLKDGTRVCDVCFVKETPRQPLL